MRYFCKIEKYLQPCTWMLLSVYNLFAHFFYLYRSNILANNYIMKINKMKLNKLRDFLLNCMYLIFFYALQSVICFDNTYSIMLLLDL